MKTLNTLYKQNQNIHQIRVNICCSKRITKYSVISTERDKIVVNCKMSSEKSAIIMLNEMKKQNEAASGFDRVLNHVLVILVLFTKSICWNCWIFSDQHHWRRYRPLFSRVYCSERRSKWIQWITRWLYSNDHRYFHNTCTPYNQNQRWIDGWSPCLVRK